MVAFQFAEILTAENLIALLTLTLLEIVLGIDNIVFIAVLTGRLDPDVQPKARSIGLMLAMGMRILLLLGISWIMKLNSDLFHVMGNGISGKDLIMLLGGLFLIFKATREIHHKIDGPDEKAEMKKKAGATFQSVIFQIVLIDIVFSLDSVITAVGMANSIYIMIAAVIISVGIMLVAAGPIGNFVNKHPTMKMLALAFLILIGVMLVAEGFDQHISKGYIYFAMAFSLAVEFLNMRARKVSLIPDKSAS